MDFKVGQVWECRDGETAKVVGTDRSGSFRITVEYSNGLLNVVTCEGRYDENEEYGYDLIELIATTTDKQIGGDHYKNKKIQPIEFIQANKLNFCEGSVIKYVTRYKEKGGVEDLKKAKHYIEILIEGMEHENN